jgi:predicted NBD/HSP70 family sugar kinase
MASTGTKKYVLGIDIGGTKLAAGVVTLTGEQLSQDRVPSLAAEGAGQGHRAADRTEPPHRSPGRHLNG